MLLAARGWSRATLKMRREIVDESAPLTHPGRERLIVDEIETDTEGDSPADLNVTDQFDEWNELSARVDLFRLVHNRSWNGGSVVVERAGNVIDWRFLNTDGSLAWSARLDEEDLACVIVTDQLLARLDETRAAAQASRLRLPAQLGEVLRFGADVELGRAAFETDKGVSNLPIQFIGSYCNEARVWSWAWNGAEVPEPSVALVRSACDPEHLREGLVAFCASEFSCDYTFAWSLAEHIAVKIGAIGITQYVDPATADGMLFAVMPEHALA